MDRDDVSKVIAEVGTGSRDSNPGSQPPQQGGDQASGKEWDLHSLKTLDHHNEPNRSRSWSQGSFLQESPCSLLLRGPTSLTVYVSVNLPILDISYTWNCKLHGLLCLVSFYLGFLGLSIL